jgi:hypothetical protein
VIRAAAAAVLAFGLAFGGLVAPVAANVRPQVTVPAGVRVPAWQELSGEQQHDLARFRDQWDAMPASRRVAILERWQRWRANAPADGETLRRGERNFRSLSPELRSRMRRSLAAISDLPPEEQRRLRRIWRDLSPEGRRAWLERGGPVFSPPPPPAKR